MTLDTSIKAISGNPQDITTVVTNSNAVQSTLVTATTMINATQPLSLNDALTLKTTATTLTTQVNGTIADLVAKKAQIVAGGQGQVTLQSLMAQKTASTALGQAVTAKVPGVAQSIGNAVNRTNLRRVRLRYQGLFYVEGMIENMKTLTETCEEK